MTAGGTQTGVHSERAGCVSTHSATPLLRPRPRRATALPARRLHFTASRETKAQALGGHWDQRGPWPSIPSLAFRLRAGLASLFASCSTPLSSLLTSIWLLQFPCSCAAGTRGDTDTRGVTFLSSIAATTVSNRPGTPRRGRRERDWIEKRVESSMHSRSTRRPYGTPLRGRPFSMPLPYYPSPHERENVPAAAGQSPAADLQSVTNTHRALMHYRFLANRYRNAAQARLYTTAFHQPARMGARLERRTSTPQCARRPSRHASHVPLSILCAMP